jgi:hypothetical protein
MAEATKRSSSRRGSSSGSSRSGSKARGGGSSNRQRNTARSGGTSGRSGGGTSNRRRSTSSRSSNGRSASGRSSPKATSRSTSSGSNAQSRNGGAIGSAVKNVAVPVASAAAGVLGGMVLAKRQMRPRKVFGVPIPGTGSGLDGVAKDIRKAGKQFGKLAGEVQTARKKAEDVGKALS